MSIVTRKLAVTRAPPGTVPRVAATNVRRGCCAGDVPSPTCVDRPPMTVRVGGIGLADVGSANVSAVDELQLIQQRVTRTRRPPPSASMETWLFPFLAGGKAVNKVTVGSRFHRRRRVVASLRREFRLLTCPRLLTCVTSSGSGSTIVTRNSIVVLRFCPAARRCSRRRGRLGGIVDLNAPSGICTDSTISAESFRERRRA